MPVNQEVMDRMKEEYGEEEGERVYYATANKENRGHDFKKKSTALRLALQKAAAGDKKEDLSPTRNDPLSKVQTGGNPARPSNAALVKYIDDPERYAAGRVSHKLAEWVRNSYTRRAEQVKVAAIASMYAIRQKVADIIPGGLADDKEPSDYPQDALQKGIEHEMEHTSDPDIAEEIAMDHIEEDPKYYTKLKKLEKDAADWGKKLQAAAAPGSALKAQGLTEAHKAKLRHSQVGKVEDDGKFKHAQAAPPMQPPAPPQPAQPPGPPQPAPPPQQSQVTLPTDQQRMEGDPDMVAQDFVANLIAQRGQQPPVPPSSATAPVPPNPAPVQDQMGPAPTGPTAPMKQAADTGMEPALDAEGETDDGAVANMEDEPDDPRMDVNLSVPAWDAPVGQIAQDAGNVGTRLPTATEAEFQQQQQEAEAQQEKIAQGTGIKDIVAGIDPDELTKQEASTKIQAGVPNPVPLAAQSIEFAQRQIPAMTVSQEEQGDTEGVPEPQTKMADTASFRPIQQHLLFTPEGKLVAKRLRDRRFAFPYEGRGKPAPYESDILYVPEEGVPDEGYHGYKVGLRVGEADQVPEGFEAVDPNEAMKDFYASMGLSVNKPFRQLDRARARAVVRYLKRKKKEREEAEARLQPQQELPVAAP